MPLLFWPVVAGVGGLGVGLFCGLNIVKVHQGRCYRRRPLCGLQIR
jgi:hypothetical protein